MRMGLRKNHEIVCYQIFMTNEKQGVPQKTLEIQVGGESYALEIQIGERGGGSKKFGNPGRRGVLRIGNPDRREGGGVKEVWKSR